MFWFFLAILPALLITTSDNVAVGVVATFICWSALFLYTSYHKDEVIQNIRLEYCQTRFPATKPKVTREYCINGTTLEPIPSYLLD